MSALNRSRTFFGRHFLRIFVICLIVVISLSSIATAADEVRRPNIILIMCDDLGYAELGCYGQKKIETPNIDRMAGEGLRFTQFYCGAPVCAPSRCVLMTGRHLANALVRNNFEKKPGLWDSYGGQFPLPTETVTMAECLKEAGYATGAFGKWGLGGVGTTGDPLKQGFDRFFGFNCQRHAHNLYPKYLVDDDKQRFLEGNTRGLTGKQYGPQVVADELMKFIESNKDRPFFAYYPTVLPHLALQAPEEDIAHYRGRWPEEPYKGRSYLPHPTPKSCYAAMITFVDKQVGRIMETLDRLGLAEDTIILFTSDNGTTHLGEQADYEFFESVKPLRGLKGSVYEGGIRVPMIARWKGKIQPGGVTDHISAAYDLMPTIAQIAGVECSAETDGVDISPTLLGKADAQKKQDFLIWEFHGYGGQQAVRMGDWKAVRTKCYNSPDSPLELYNLADDIGETKNVAAEHPELVEQMERILKEERTPSKLWNFER